MTKVFAFMLAVTLMLSLCACGKKSCGDTHTWGEWEKVVEATNYTPATFERTCTQCGEKETKESFYQMFGHYAELLRWIPFFTEAERLQQNLDGVITAAFFSDVPVQTRVEDYVYIHTIKVSDLHDFTTKVFGCTYDYTGVENMWVLFESKASYDAALDAIIVRAMGAGNETAELKDVTYEETEGGVYMVTATFTLFEESYEKNFCVIEKDGNYVISTY